MKKVYLHLLATSLIIAGFSISANGQWLSQYAASYHNRGTLNPTMTLQTSSSTYTTSNYKYPYWTLNATAGTTYYFDLCNSTGGSLSATRLILHNGIYGTFNTTQSTITIQNIANGCSGSGTGFSKLIWTCEVSGTYYLESAASASATFWGVSATQTNVLRYYTLPSQITACSVSFYDTGITGSNGDIYGYNNNESWVTTYFPSVSGNVIEATFTTFDTQAGTDLLYVFDGPNTTSPMFPGSPFSGQATPGTFKATSCEGAITFRFTSNNTMIGNGWVVNINCVPGSSNALNVNITGSNSICAGTPSTLSANVVTSNGPITMYQWQLDGVDINGANGPTFDATLSGNYTLVVSDASGCTITTSVFTVTSSLSPFVSISGATSACAGDSTHLIVNANPGSGTIASYQWQLNGVNIPGATSSDYYAGATGAYTAIVTNSAGCSTTSSTINVNISPAPDASFTSGTNGATATFDNTSLDGTTYSWDFGDGSPTDNSFEPSHTYQWDGTYTVTLTVTNSCGTSVYTQQVTITTTSIASHDNAFPVQLYPNPADHTVYIRTGLPVSENFKVRIFNAYGQKVYDQEVKDRKQSEFRIDISSFASGHYIVTIVANESTVNTPLEVY